MKWIGLIVFSFYLLIKALYYLYAEPDPDYKFSVLNSLWFLSTDILIIFYSGLIFLRLHEIELRKMSGIICVFSFLNAIFETLNIFKIATVSSEIWSGFLFLTIFVLILTLASHE